MSEYTPTIGLEIHAELKTRTKMFCASKNDPDEERPNYNVCPVCMAHPGTLPVVNREAVRQVLRVGSAISGTLADYTEFDRKNYFYPDIPKGYQISQFEYPLVRGGSINGVAVTRIHLEEDTANNKHRGDVSLIDFNRAGIPLMELVTEPVIHDAKTAGDFARELQLLLRALGASDANMDKGQMRVEVNISISKDATLGVKNEVKNINSFRAVERAIEYEIKRQTEILESGGALVQETRGWDEPTGTTFSQRKKENSHDYRYFPDPDIPKLKISDIPEFSGDTLHASLPELPWVRRARYLALGIKADDAEALIADATYQSFFDSEIASSGMSERAVLLFSNYLMADVRGSGAGVEDLARLKGTFPKLIAMIEADQLSSRGAKDVLSVMLKDGGDPMTIATTLGAMQVVDEGAIEKVVIEVLTENQKAVEEVRAGKAAAIQFLVGAVMKKSKGSAKPDLARALIEKNVIL